MDPITIGLLGMGGLSAISNLDKEGRQVKLAAATQRYSPWTGLKAQPVDYANPAGDLAQGGASALSYGQNQQAAKSLQALQAAQIAALNRGSMSPYGRINSSSGAYDGNPNQWAG